MQRVTVDVAPAYDVVVGRDALTELGQMVERRRRAHVVTERAVIENCEWVLASTLDLRALPVAYLEGGERAKSFAGVESLCRSFAAAGLLRADLVVALGGGVVGDTAGFAAAIYHRGVAVVQVPTTLLAQVDAAIGGKTAVNLPEGKNLVGAFHQPVGVVADTRTLGSLPDSEYRSGLGEVVKYALMPEGRAVAELLERGAARVLAREPDALEELVVACAAIKAAVVTADPEERSGLRARLNYGHTLAHALETTSGHALSHGEAVAIGLVFAAELAYRAGRVDADTPARARAVLGAIGLPTRVPAGTAGAAKLLTVMQRDKKSTGGLSFVLPGANRLEVVTDAPDESIEGALRAVGVGA